MDQKNKAILRIGLVSGLFLIYYSILRMVAEIFREPDQQLGYFIGFVSMGTILSIITLVVGLLMVFSIKDNEKNN